VTGKTETTSGQGIPQNPFAVEANVVVAPQVLEGVTDGGKRKNSKSKNVYSKANESIQTTIGIDALDASDILGVVAAEYKLLHHLNNALE